jgi:hypothetical protein
MNSLVTVKLDPARAKSPQKGDSPFALLGWGLVWESHPGQ